VLDETEQTSELVDTSGFQPPIRELVTLLDTLINLII